MSATAHEPAPAVPTEAAPEFGDVSVGGVVISSVDHWVADGLHVFRSLEFDLVAEHEDELRAVELFIDNAADLVFYLTDLIRERQATENEIETASLLLPRFMGVWEDSERALRAAQRRILNLPRRRRPSAGWRRQSTPSSSSRPLPV